MESKKWYQSKTIWGIVIAFVGFVLNNYLQVEISLPESGDYELIKKHIESIQDAKSSTMVLVSEAMSFIGTLVAIYGRFKAEEKLTK